MPLAVASLHLHSLSTKEQGDLTSIFWEGLEPCGGGEVLRVTGSPHQDFVLGVRGAAQETDAHNTWFVMTAGSRVGYPHWAGPCAYVSD